MNQPQAIFFFACPKDSSRYFNDGLLDFPMHCRTAQNASSILDHKVVDCKLYVEREGGIRTGVGWRDSPGRRSCVSLRDNKKCLWQNTLS